MLKLLTGMNFPGAPAPDLQLQPAGFDLSLQGIARFTSTGTLDLSNAKRELPSTEPVLFPEDGQPCKLSPGGYLVTYNEEIAVPDDCAGLVLPRSSLMRCGAVLHSALWDPGYQGRGQGLLSVHQELALYKDARIGQFILIKLEDAAAELYAGKYQGENL